MSCAGVVLSVNAGCSHPARIPVVREFIAPSTLSSMVCTYTSPVVLMLACRSAPCASLIDPCFCMSVPSVLLLLVPASSVKTQIECAKNILRYPSISGRPPAAYIPTKLIREKKVHSQCCTVYRFGSHQFAVASRFNLCQVVASEPVCTVFFDGDSHQLATGSHSRFVKQLLDDSLDGAF